MKIKLELPVIIQNRSVTCQVGGGGECNKMGRKYLGRMTLKGNDMWKQGNQINSKQCI